MRPEEIGRYRSLSSGRPPAGPMGGRRSDDVAALVAVALRPFRLHALGEMSLPNAQDAVRVAAFELAIIAQGGLAAIRRARHAV